MDGKKLLSQKLKFPGPTDAPPINIEFPKERITPGALLGEDLTLAKIINEGMSLLFFAVGLMLFGYLLYGGFKYLTSLGDDTAIAEAKGTITYALIGFAIVISAFFITRIFGNLFDITIF